MPFKSKAQRRLFYAKMNSGGIDKDTVDEFEKSTKDKKLPEYVSKTEKLLKKRKR